MSKQETIEWLLKMHSLYQEHKLDGVLWHQEEYVLMKLDLVDEFVAGCIQCLKETDITKSPLSIN